MKIGIGQMNSQSNKIANLDVADAMICELVQAGASLIMLPEHFNYLGQDSEKPKNSETIDSSPSLDMVRQRAKEFGVHIHIGSFLEKEGNQTYNTAVVFDPSGCVVAKYRKIHLFDVKVPGGKRYFESDTISPGDSLKTFTIRDLTFGLATCYDLRFPEMFRKLVELGANVFLLPAAFTLETGRDHWELLLRARAVENLCWLVAANQYGPSPPNNISYGRSMIINPWGIITSQAPDGVCTITGEIRAEIIHQSRTTFPALDHRRKDIFPS